MKNIKNIFSYVLALILIAGTCFGLGNGGGPITPIATTARTGKVKPDGSTITIQADGTISAPTGGGGNVTGPESSVVGSIPYWGNTAGTSLTAGLAVSTMTNGFLCQYTTANGLNCNYDPAGFATAAHNHTGIYQGATSNLSTVSIPTAWRIFYSDGSQVQTELALGASGTVLYSNGASAAPSFTAIPTASASTLGLVKVDGTTVTITDGVISSASAYELPTASPTVLGGVKIDNSTITITDGVISATTEGTGTVTNVSSANADISVATGTSTPVLTLNSGSTANKILKLDGSGRIPAISGELLTGITSSQVGAVAANTAITGATKTKLTYDAKGLITAGADATTADIADSTNKRYVTDAQLTVIGATSGTNTGDQTITLTGDVTGSGTGSFATTIAASSVTLSKMANMATASLLGRNTTGTGVPEVLSASTVRSLLGLVIGTNVQAYDAELAALAGLTSAADTLPYFTGSGTAGTTSLTSFGRSLIDDANAAAALSTIGAQASDSELSAIAGLTSAADTLPYFTGSGTAGTTSLTTTGRSIIDDTSVGAVRTTLGIDTDDAVTFGSVTAPSFVSSASDGEHYVRVSNTSAPTYSGAATGDFAYNATTGKYPINNGTDWTSKWLVTNSDVATASVAGVVSAGGTNYNMVWKTDGSGVPGWRADATGTSPSFDLIASGTNTSAAMLVGAGSSLGPTSTGTITGTSLLDSDGTGTFLITGTTAARTFTVPDQNTTLLTTANLITVAQGGTGANTLTGIVKGNGTSAMTAVTAPTGDIVGTSDTQTLTNKTLTSPVISDGSTITFDESAVDPNDADVALSGSDGVFKIASVNGANNEDLTIDLDGISNTVSLNSTTGVTALAFNGLNLSGIGTLSTQKTSGTADAILLANDYLTSAYGAGWQGPHSVADMTYSYYLGLPNVEPSNGQILVAGTPSSHLSAQSWVSTTGTGNIARVGSPTFIDSIITPQVDFGTTGGRVSASGGTVTIAGLGNTNNENLTVNLESTSNEATVGSGTGVNLVRLVQGMAIGANNPIVDKSGSASLTVAEMNSTVYVSAAATITLPEVVASSPTSSQVTPGAMVCVYSTGANVVRVDVNANDRMRLNGTAQTAGVDIYSAGAAGNFGCFQADSASGYTSWGLSGIWTQGS